jgi:arylsulfatase A-like enzyme
MNTTAKPLIGTGIFIIVGLLTTLTGGCERRQIEPRHNVVIILLDTFRADRMGSSVAGSGITPAIDQFARRGVVFNQAFSHAPWTLPSVASIFTSQLPVQHGAGGSMGSFKALSPDAVTIAEVFQGHGAKTGAISNVIFLTNTFGAMQGFDTLDAEAKGDNDTLRDAESTTDAALEWIIENDGQRFFLFVHYFDPHLKYDPPQPFRREHADAADAERDDYLFGSVSDMLRLRRGQHDLSPPLLSRLEKLYDGEIAYIDHEVARLLNSLGNLSIAQDTIVVLTADHGEEFLDHGGFEHGHTLYDELLRVPLIIWEPGTLSANNMNAEETNRIVDTPVRHIDLAPTLFHLTGVTQGISFSGRSLAPLIAGQHETGRAVLSQATLWGNSGNAFRQDGFKLIEYSDSGSIQLFDIRNDLDERIDLSNSDQDRASTMRDELHLVLDKLQTKGDVNETLDLNDEQRQKLRALGYLD